jgi:hypothetical protein
MRVQMGSGASKRHQPAEPAAEGIAGPAVQPASKPASKNGEGGTDAADGPHQPAPTDEKPKAVPKRMPKLSKAAFKPPEVDDDIVQHASMLGLNITNEADHEFLWIAERAARDVMRPPWVRLMDEKDGRTYYYNGSTGVSSWKTPYLDQYKKFLVQRRRAKKQAESEAAAVAANAAALGGEGAMKDMLGRAMSGGGGRGAAVEADYHDMDDKVVLMAAGLSSKVTRMMQEHMPRWWGVVEGQGPDRLDMMLNYKLRMSLRSLSALSTSPDPLSASTSPEPRSSPLPRGGGGGGVAGMDGGGGRWWFKAEVRCCQIPSLRACLKLVDKNKWQVPSTPPPP